MVNGFLSFCDWFFDNVAPNGKYFISPLLINGSALRIFTFPTSISQSTIGDRFGSNACTLITEKFGAYCFQNKLDLSLLWNQLPDIWFNSFVNEVYDELYSNTAVYLDVEDVVNAVGDLFSVESAEQIFAFTNANEFHDLVDHINGVIQVSHTDNYDVMISQNMTVGVLVKSNGLCAIIDSHQQVNSDGGGMIIVANDPKKASCLLKNQNLTLDLGTLNWVKYRM